MSKKGEHDITGLPEDREDAILEGINNIAQFVETATKTNKDAVDGLKSKVDGVETLVSKVEERFNKKHDETVQIIADKVARMEKRQAATGRLSIVDTTDVILAAVADEDRQGVRLLEGTMSPTRDRGRFAEPVFKGGCELWFKYATRLQLPGRFGQTRDQDEKKLNRLTEALGGAEQKAVLIEGTDALGGYLVPDPVAAEILRLIEDNSVMRPLVTKIPMDSKTLDLPKGSGGISAAIVGENAAIGDSVGGTPFSVATLTAKKFAGRAQASIESLQDSVVGLMGYIQTRIAEAIGQLEDKQCLEGDGTGSNFTGLATDAGVNEIAGGANGTAITYDIIVSMVYKARQRSSRIGARWYGAPETKAKVVGLKDSQLMPVFQFNNVPGAIAQTLLGFPFEDISTIRIDRSIGTAGATGTFLYFGVPTGVVFGDRQGMSWEVSNAPGWNNYLLDMRLVKRTGIAIGVPAAFTRHTNLTTV